MINLEFSDLIGFLGALSLLLAYAFLQYGTVKSNSFSYSLLNFLGALLILYSLLYAWNLSVAFIETVWMIISGWGLIKSILLKMENKIDSPVKVF